jgi:hypothetical protein
VQRFSTILTSEQAAFLFDLVKEHQTAIVGRTSRGIYDGFLMSLSQIDRGGGARLNDKPLDYGRGMVAGAIIGPATYSAWPGVTDVPKLFEPVGVLPVVTYRSLFWKEVSLYRTRMPLAIIPLPPVVVMPPLPLK